MSNTKEAATKAAEVKPSGASVTVINSAAAPAPKAKLRRRHVWLITTFVAMVITPVIVASYYMVAVAHDQYLSKVSFSVRSQETQSPLDALAGLGQLSTGASSDASILNEYLRSQKLVEDISQSVDLVAVYTRPEGDPVFSFNPERPFEDLVSYFHRMNYVTFDATNGLLDVEAYAFSPEDAQQIASEILRSSSALVERLSSIAHEDTTKLARLELDLARERLKETRLALGEFRTREQIVDPQTDLEGQMGVLTALQNQLAEVLVDYDVLLTTTSEGDPRMAAAQNRIDAIRHRIDEEREKIGTTNMQGEASLAAVVGDFETLMAEREFGEQSFLAAAVNFDAALAEARRKSKYVAAHIPPTRARSAQYPQRALWIAGVFGICLLLWSVSLLTGYAMLDRR